MALSGLKTNDDMKHIADVIWSHKIEAPPTFRSESADHEELKLKVNETIELKIQVSEIVPFSLCSGLLSDS